MVVDRPPDLQGPSAARGGRFARRYRDCLLQFIQNVSAPPGEVQCSPSSGYAIGSEIGLPPSVPAWKLPGYADQEFVPYWGRWEGDSESGAYLIAESVGVRSRYLILRMGYSSPPGEGKPVAGMADVHFQSDQAHGRIFSRLGTGDDMVILRLKSATELEYEVRRGDNRRLGRDNPRVLLRKRNGLPATP